jgi:hypothetical protein
LIIPPRRIRRFPAFETYSGWARIIGVSSYKCRRLMSASGISPRFHGKLKVVYLSDLRRMNPDLWESLRLRRELDQEDAA